MALLKAGWAVWITASSLMTGAMGVACGQAYTPPPPPLTTAPCVPTKRAPCNPPKPPQPAPAGNSPFDFPGEGEVKTLPPVETVGDPAHPAETPRPAPARKTAPDADSNDKFAFPGGGASPATSSSSSSTPDGDAGGDASTATTPRRPAAGSERRKLPKSEDLAGREAEDLEIAHYYMTTGAYTGSYNRAKDALRLAPDDPEAHYAVAVAARSLKNPGEAKAEFTAYLKLAPDGDHVRAAQKAIAGLR